MASGLGLEDVHEVCSPSFTLINIYQAKFTIFHMDLYRLSASPEIDDLGWEDYLGQGILIIEWSEKLNFQQKAIHVAFKVLPDYKRQITLEYLL
jgi:tRNA threonylcarbamoyladenosine biosynthesis protein TsaE